MIPALNMTKLHRSPPANNPHTAAGASGPTNTNSTTTNIASVGGQGSASRLHTSRQMSPRTPNVTSPRDANSSQASAHLTRRAADVAAVLEMNPMQCQSVTELQRKLIETAEWVMRLRCYYILQLQERDQWLEGRLRELEKYYTEAVSLTVEARVAAASAAALATSASNNSNTCASTTTALAATGNGAPATISTSKVGLSSGNVGVPHGAVSEAKTAESEKASSTTPPRRRRNSKQQQQQGKQKSEQRSEPTNSALSSIVNSPQPSLPNNAQADAISLTGGGGDSNPSSSAGRTRANGPKKSVVVRIPQVRRTVSASGAARRHAARHDDDASPRLNGGGAATTAATSAVDRGEARPTRAARLTAEKDNNNNNSGGGGGIGGAGASNELLMSTDSTNATRRRAAPPALSASRGSARSGFVDGSNGPRLESLAATVPATMRPGKSALMDSTSANYLALSTGGDLEHRRRSESSNSRRRSYTASPRAAAAAAAASASATSGGKAELSATAPPHSQYLEAGVGLGREWNNNHNNNNNSSSTNSAAREHNGLNTSVGSVGDLPQSRTPRDGSTFLYLLGSGAGSRPGRLYNSGGGSSSRASQRSASRGLSGRAKRKGTSSGNASAQSSPSRVHTF